MNARLIRPSEGKGIRRYMDKPELYFPRDIF